MKESAFKKRFRHEFGMSAHQWILKQKAERVKQSLLLAKRPMSSLAKEHGFNSATHFVRFCRQQYGMNPTQLRKKLQSDLNVYIKN